MTANDAPLSSDDIQSMNIDALFQRLGTSKDGLSISEANNRLQKYGYNKIEEKKRSPLLRFLRYFSGPIPWMIEIAAILSIVVRHWADFFIIVALLLVNGLVDFWEEFQAGNAIEALKNTLALKCLVQRGGKWQEMDATELVPGDVIRLRAGNVIPADAKLIEGDYLTVDQSMLTGESLPVSKKINDIIFSGSVAKQGEILGVVASTGQNTFFWKNHKACGKGSTGVSFSKSRVANWRLFDLSELGSFLHPCHSPTY